MSAYPVVFPVDYLVVQYPNEELAGYFNHTNHNFYFDAPPTIRFAGVEAQLERIHIHSRSEHLLDGVDFDFEIHFVHPLPNPVDPTSTTGHSTHVVLGVFFKESSSATTPRTIRFANDSITFRFACSVQRGSLASQHSQALLCSIGLFDTNRATILQSIPRP
jgi:Eukaryotic-type carbonic anhydrase